MRMRVSFALVAGLLLMGLLSGCAPGANPLAHTTGSTGAEAGFWLGIWHGLICVITFVVSLFDRHVNIYEVHNTGWPYNLGFVMGASGALCGGSGAACRRKSQAS